MAATCLVITWHRCLYCGQNNSTMRTNSLLSFSFFLPSRSACFCLLSLPKLYKCLVNIFIVLWESDMKMLISFPALPADLTLSKVCTDHLSVSKPDSTLVESSFSAGASLCLLYIPVVCVLVWLPQHAVPLWIFPPALSSLRNYIPACGNQQTHSLSCDLHLAMTLATCSPTGTLPSSAAPL